MGPVSIEDLLNRCGSVYKLVILSAQRAKAVAEGAKPLVQTSSKKATSIALEEVLHGRVLYKAEPSEEGDTTRGRHTRAKKAHKS